MRKVNTNEMAAEKWSSPKGKFAGAYQEISVALGSDQHSAQFEDRHPFDVEICRIPPGKLSYPYHSHSAQWEFYHVLSGQGMVRHREGSTAIRASDAFMFAPGHPHQIANDGSEDLVLYVVADNPLGESCYYPDSKKWLVRSPERSVIRSDPLEYLDGEE